MTKNRACKKYEMTIVECVDGSLTGDERVSFERHLAECAGCRHVLEAQTRLHGLTAQAARTPSRHDSVAGEVVAMVRDDRAGNRGGVLFFWVGSGAAIAAVALAISLLWTPGGPVIPGGSTGTPFNPQPVAAEPLSIELCAREHARASVSFAPADRAAWSLALAQSNSSLAQ